MMRTGATARTESWRTPHEFIANSGLTATLRHVKVGGHPRARPMTKSGGVPDSDNRTGKATHRSAVIALFSRLLPRTVRRHIRIRKGEKPMRKTTFAGLLV